MNEPRNPPVMCGWVSCDECWRSYIRGKNPRITEDCFRFSFGEWLVRLLTPTVIES